jgi:sulfoquinovose isomerase
MTDTSWDDTAHRAWLAAETERLLHAAATSLHPGGGFAWLESACQPMLDRPIECWITTRMTHVLALGTLLGHDDYLAHVEHGVRCLGGQLHDAVNDGWFTQDSVEGRKEKRAYDHDFVILAASSAVVAGAHGARELLDAALDVYTKHFWDETNGRVLDVWNADWTEAEPYLGANANMHAVEALLAAADVTGNVVWLQRALRIAEWFINLKARFNNWRIPEHFTPNGDALLEYNVDQPGHPFRPYGATIGHAFEWARLLLHIDASLELAGEPTQSWLPSAARQLFTQAIADGWAVDGAPGFVYTTDWTGKPVVSDRLHWVTCEAIAAAAALLEATGDPQYDELYQQWWAYAQAHFVDIDGGSWTHQLNAMNEPSSSVWSGKPDVYHAIQACLLPRLPLAPSLATSLAAGNL